MKVWELNLVGEGSTSEVSDAGTRPISESENALLQLRPRNRNEFSGRQAIANKKNTRIKP